MGANNPHTELCTCWSKVTLTEPSPLELATRARWVIQLGTASVDYQLCLRVYVMSS